VFAYLIGFYVALAAAAAISGSLGFQFALALFAVYFPVQMFLAMGIHGVAQGGHCPLIWNPCVITLEGWALLILFWVGVSWLLAWIAASTIRAWKSSRSDRPDL